MGFRLETEVWEWEVLLPLGRKAAEQWVQKCLRKVVGGPVEITSSGFSTRTSRWPWANNVLVEVTLRRAAFGPPFEEATEAIVSAWAVGQLFDWGASKRLVRKLRAALADPGSQYDLDVRKAMQSR